MSVIRYRSIKKDEHSRAGTGGYGRKISYGKWKKKKGRTDYKNVRPRFSKEW